MRRRFTPKHNNDNIDVNNYLTIEALEDGLTAKLSDNTCEYCVDGDGNWKKLAANTETKSINVGQTLSFRGNLYPNTVNGIGTFTVNKNFNLKGNVMSMLFADAGKDYYTLYGRDYAFFKLFTDCTTLKSISANFLPATILSEYCYRDMFSHCTNLIAAPDIPATTLARSCCSFMFSGCTSLTTAPALSATSLGSCCYEYMFYECTSLTTAPTLPATDLATYCYDSMFYRCISLKTAPELPATTLASNCYNSMFRYCTSLTTAPALPATTLKSSCYDSMFYGCSSLTVAPELPATVVYNRCYQNMFYGCTSLTVAPELPATTLEVYCYYCMFRSCTNLKYITMLATDISEPNCLLYWVEGVASSGKFVKNPNATWDVVGVSGVPKGWTVVYPE